MSRTFSSEQRAIGFVLIGAFLLRLFTLGSESLWLDEALMNYRVSFGIRGILSDWDSHRQGPLYPLLLRMWTLLFGDSEVSLRLPSVVFGTLAVHALWLLTKDSVGKMAAWIVAVLAAVNPLLIHYSQEARPYAMWVWLIALSLWFLIKYCENASRLNSSGYVLTTLGALYLHPYGPFVLLSHAVVLWTLARAKWRDFLRPAGVILLGYAPMGAVFAYTFLRKIEDPWIAGAWLTPPTFAVVGETFKTFFFWPPLAWSTIGLIVLGVLHFRMSIRPLKPGLTIAAALVASFIVLPWIISQAVPIYFARYTQPALVGVLILVGTVIAQMKKPLRVFAVGSFIALTILPLVNLYAKIDKDPWRQVVGLVTSEAKSSDKIIVVPFYARHPFNHYDRDLHAPQVSSPKSLRDLEAALPDSGTVWYISAKYHNTDSLDGLFLRRLQNRGRSTLSVRLPNASDVNPGAFNLFPIDVMRFEVQPLESAPIER